MKASFKRDGWLAAAEVVSVAIPPCAITQMLGSVKWTGDGESCALMPTELVPGMRVDVPGAKVEEGGDAILPASRTIAILRESTDEELRLEADADRCLVRGQLNEYEMASEDPANFPDVPIFGEEKYH